jgi:hypothetical protein
VVAGAPEVKKERKKTICRVRLLRVWGFLEEEGDGEK